MRNKKNVLEEIDLNITSKCNICCNHCLFSAKTNGDDLPLKKVFKVLEDGKSLGAKEVHVSGGEPLLHKNYLKILQRAHELGYFVRLQTNCFALTPEIIKEIKPFVKEVLTSVDGMKEAHDKIRKAGSFDRTINCIKELASQKIRVVVVTAVQNINYKDVPKLAEFLNDLGVSAHFFFSLTPLGRVQPSQIISAKNWELMITKLKKIAEDKKIDNLICEIHHMGANFDRPINFLEPECRLKTKNHAIILPDGGVFPCSIFTSSNKALGNILEQDLDDIWLNSKTWSFYNYENNDQKCADCSEYKFCKGGCPGYSYLFGGDINGRDPRCGKDRIPVCLSWKLNVRNFNLSLATWKVMKR
jgi:radical SAM protein with 4Fe4S-binding SPASM domain